MHYRTKNIMYQALVVKKRHEKRDFVCSTKVYSAEKKYQ